MVISDENTKPQLIDSITTPLSFDYFWVLDLEERDFKLSKIEVLEQHETPILVLQILGWAVEIPASWSILIYSEDTSQLDTAEAYSTSRDDFTAFVFDTKKNVNVPGRIKCIEYKPRGTIRMPSLNKTQMLCHHLGPIGWICISPIDNFNKYLKGAAIGDILP